MKREPVTAQEAMVCVWRLWLTINPNVDYDPDGQGPAWEASDLIDRAIRYGVEGTDREATP